MTKILVFAGNFRQFENWVRNNFNVSKYGVPKDVVYVNTFEKSLGYSDVVIVKTGTWYEHKWAQEAIARLENMNIEKAVKKIVS